MIEIRTPEGVIRNARTKNGRITARLTWNPEAISQRNQGFSRAQKFVDSEVLRLSAPYIPLRTGMLIKSGTLGTQIGSGIVRYIAIYARKQYHENKGKGKRGPLWFERMKVDHKQSILRGAAKITGGKP